MKIDPSMQKGHELSAEVQLLKHSGRDQQRSEIWKILLVSFKEFFIENPLSTRLLPNFSSWWHTRINFLR
jgi:hypothetical protein